MSNLVPKRQPNRQRRPAVPGLLTREEATVYLGISSSSLAHWSCHGKGPVRMLIGRRTYYRLADLDFWLASQSGVMRGR